jgi:hypothetical protein
LIIKSCGTIEIKQDNNVIRTSVGLSIK